MGFEGGCRALGVASQNSFREARKATPRARWVARGHSRPLGVVALHPPSPRGGS